MNFCSLSRFILELSMRLTIMRKSSNFCDNFLELVIEFSLEFPSWTLGYFLDCPLDISYL
jgi:hypothetical protein